MLIPRAQFCAAVWSPQPLERSTRLGAGTRCCSTSTRGTDLDPSRQTSGAKIWFPFGFGGGSLQPRPTKECPLFSSFCHGRWSLAPAEAWVDQFEMHSPEGPPPLFAGEPDPPAASVAMSFNFEHPRTCLADVQIHAPMPPFWWMHPPGRMTMLGSAKTKSASIGSIPTSSALRKGKHTPIKGLSDRVTRSRG